MIEAGCPAPLGATFDGEGVNFSLFSAAATRVEVCLFDASAGECKRIFLPGRTDDIWHGYLPGCKPGQRYGYRVHGDYDPRRGLRCNANKLLIDPYARELSGQFCWSPSVFDFAEGSDTFELNDLDSAASVPKCVVTEIFDGVPARRTTTPWSDTIIYELNVRGYTMRHPEVPELERGTFRGLSNAAVLAYIKALGITAIELMPVQAFIDEQFLIQRGLRNFWGYNTLNFFAPEPRYASGSPRLEFLEMVNAIHDAGLEVLLDVAYNHTGEGNRLGPSVSFRGIDNPSYYLTAAHDPGEYLNQTGCGNTINVDHPQVRALIIDSMRYWARDMGVDGFRFDLATVLGQSSDGFSRDHPLWQSIENDPLLGGLKLIAEPWNPGHGGYQLGNFPSKFGEWNDRFRDSVRRYWRNDKGEAAELTKRLLGSADLFEVNDKTPRTSINLLTAHDGFTLRDVVSFEQRHNETNGEQSLDGHHHNFSCNYGIEGPANNNEINRMRRKQRLNMLATLFVSQGTPILLAGDEFGNSQHGNNNAYAQDNEVGWLDWSGLDHDSEFQAVVRQLIQHRKTLPLLRQQHFLHGETGNADGWPDIAWLRADGQVMHGEDWGQAGAFGAVLASTVSTPTSPYHAFALLLNPSLETIEFGLPAPAARRPWRTIFSTDPGARIGADHQSLELPSRSLVMLVLDKLDDDMMASQHSLM